MVIVGAGECGGRAAVTLRELGWLGSITLIGAEAYPPYERPPLSKTFLTDKTSPLFKGNADSERFDELSITHRAACRVISIDRGRRHVLLESGETMEYHRLLLAVGAEARRLPVKGADTIRVLRSHSDAVQLRAHLTAGKRVVIIGGGFIGLELAASATQLGAKVTLIEAQARLLSRIVPADIAAIIEDRHRVAGVELHIGAGLAEIAADTIGSEITLTSGKHIAGEIVIAGVGAEPNVSLAKEAGLEIDNGIAADASFRTSDPAIFTAGDCAAVEHPFFGRRLRLESWRSAQEHGVLAAHNMLDRPAVQDAMPWFWSDQYELCLQIAGLPDLAVAGIDRRLAPDAVLKFGLDAAGRLVSASAIGPLEMIAKDMKLAERLIARKSQPDPRALADPAQRLKSLLAA